MSAPTPTLGEPQDEFSLPPVPGADLTDLVAAAEFDDVHFFLGEAISAGAIDAPAPAEKSSFTLLPYDHPDQAIDATTFEAIEEAGYEQATLADLLCLAIARPDLQREFDVVALGTLRTRRIHTDEAGETVWDQSELDKSICQWATGLSNLKQQRTLVPVELFLDKVLRKPTLILVRKV